MIISYKAHIQNYGWSEEKTDGETAGTVGEGLRLEALSVTSDYRLRCKAHVQNAGWQDWVVNGETAGTEGQGLRLEAFCIELTGDTDKHVWYRVHVENVGWTDWTIDGGIAGSVGESLRLEAIEIQIVDAASNAEFAKWYENHRKCKLGDVIFSSTTSESTTMSNDITDKPIEGGNVSDHVVNKPLTMSIGGVIIGDDCQEKLETLRGYVTNGDLLRYVGCDSAKNMVIESFETGRSVSMKGGVSFTLSLKEIRIATGMVTVIDEAYVYTQANSVKKGGLQIATTAAQAAALANGQLPGAAIAPVKYGLTVGETGDQYLVVDKKKMPYSVEVNSVNVDYLLEFNYNPSGDFFTVSCTNPKTNKIVSSGSRLVLNSYVWQGANLGGDRPTMVPYDPTGKEKKITWENFGDKVLLGFAHAFSNDMARNKALHNSVYPNLVWHPVEYYTGAP